MLSMSRQDAFSNIARGRLIRVESSDSSRWVNVRVDSFSWYRTKCIFLGRVVDAVDPTHLGVRYIGTTAPIVAMLTEDPTWLAFNPTAAELEYLTQPFDLVNPSTNHELTAAEGLTPLELF